MIQGPGCLGTSGWAATSTVQGEGAEKSRTTSSKSMIKCRDCLAMLSPVALRGALHFLPARARKKVLSSDGLTSLIKGRDNTPWFLNFNGYTYIQIQWCNIDHERPSAGGNFAPPLASDLIWSILRPLPSSCTCRPPLYFFLVTSNSGFYILSIFFFPSAVLKSAFFIHRIILFLSAIAQVEFWRPQKQHPLAMWGLQSLSLRHWSYR